MKILVTGTAGRVGRAIYIKLMKSYTVSGLDRLPCSTADFVGDLREPEVLNSALAGVEVIVHTAALHAPHVDLLPESEFESINVTATETLMREGIKRGIKHFVFTSTTALYGKSCELDEAAWIDESVIPKPRTIYHRSKIDAEDRLERLSRQYGIPVTVLQMSRCFPEPADVMALYRLSRGIDARDVAAAHGLAIERRLEGFRRFIISGVTPFFRECCNELYHDAASTIRKCAPDLARDFASRAWMLPSRIDRVYDSSAAQKELAWYPKYGYESVLRMLDEEVSEVLPVIKLR